MEEIAFRGEDMCIYIRTQRCFKERLGICDTEGRSAVLNIHRKDRLKAAPCKNR